MPNAKTAKAWRILHGSSEGEPRKPRNTASVARRYPANQSHSIEIPSVPVRVVDTFPDTTNTLLQEWGNVATAHQSDENRKGLPAWLEYPNTHLILLTILLGCSYGFSANYSIGNVDSVAAALPAWKLVTTGDINLDDELDIGEYVSSNPALVDSAHGVVSNRMPGIIAIAIPAYLISRLEQFGAAPATATTVVATTAAMLVTYLVLLRIVRPFQALAATLVLALGTSTWQISSNELWPHGPGQLWAALSLLGVSRRSISLTAVSIFMAIITRPIVIVIALIIALGASLDAQRRKVGITIAISSSISIGSIALYNFWIYGSLTLSGGYGTSFAERATTLPSKEYFHNLSEMLLSPTVGLFFWTPIVLVSMIFVPRVWRLAPSWVKWSGLAAMVYLLLHAHLNRASGGVIFGYRYPLEPLTFATPLLTLSCLHMWKRSNFWRNLVILGIGLSLTFQLALVYAYDCRLEYTNRYKCSLF